MEKRHHVHVCYASGDLAIERSVVMQRLAQSCFFTWNLEDINPISSSFARQQIDACDYVIFLIGGRYGALSISGVSYLHLDFIYASTKKKPMIVMFHANPELADMPDDDSMRQHQRKLNDFRDQVKKQTKKIHYFSSILEFTNKLTHAYSELTESHPESGWVKEKSSKSFGAELNLQKSLLDDIRRDITGSYDAVSARLKRVNLNDLCYFSYQTHAFEGGNFSEVVLRKKMAWGDLLVAVSNKFKLPTSEDMLARVINELLDTEALNDVKVKQPNAHAASRSQISSNDLERIKTQFFLNDWLKIASTSTKTRRMFMLTSQGARQAAQWQSVINRI